MSTAGCASAQAFSDDRHALPDYWVPVVVLQRVVKEFSVVSVDPALNIAREAVIVPERAPPLE